MDKPRIVDVKQGVDGAVSGGGESGREERVEEELPLHERKPRVVEASEKTPAAIEKPVDNGLSLVETPSGSKDVVKAVEVQRAEKPVSVNERENGVEMTPAPSVALERKGGVVQPPVNRPVEVVAPSSGGVPLAGKLPPWVGRTDARPTVKQVVEAGEAKEPVSRRPADLSNASPVVRDVVTEYRQQASRDLLPSSPDSARPLSIGEEREKARRVALEISAKKGEDSFFTKLRKRLLG